MACGGRNFRIAQFMTASLSEWSILWSIKSISDTSFLISHAFLHILYSAYFKIFKQIMAKNDHRSKYEFGPYAALSEPESQADLSLQEWISIINIQSNNLMWPRSWQAGELSR